MKTEADATRVKGDMREHRDLVVYNASYRDMWI